MPAPDSDTARTERASVAPSTAKLSARLSAVERALDACPTDRDSADDSTTDLDARLRTVEADLATLSDRLSEVEAATQAVRGYVGSIRATNERVRRRADRALAATERLRVDEPSESRDRCDPNGASSKASALSTRSTLANARDAPSDDGPRGDDAAVDSDEAGESHAPTDAGESAGDRPILDRLGDVL